MYSSQWTGSGSQCFRTLTSCSPSSDNWVFTQYISKTADVTYALGISVDIEGDTSSCDGCNSNAVKVYYYPNNGPFASGAQLNTDNYILIGNASFGATVEKQSLSFSLGSQYDRFYIAMVAEDTCFTFDRLLVSYKVCLMEMVALVIYPETPIGASGVSTSASCAANATLSLGSSLSITCGTNGSYSGSPTCSCVDGYFLAGETCNGKIIQFIHSK